MGGTYSFTGARVDSRSTSVTDVEPMFIDMLDDSSPDDVRLRFFAPLKNFDHRFAARLTQIDYDREIALVAMPGEPFVEIGLAVKQQSPFRHTFFSGVETA